MSKPNPVLLLLLAVVISFAVFLKVSSPHKKYSTRGFWESATIESVREVPDEVLADGNENGPVLMWASIASVNPDVIEAIIARGVDVNESDVIFQGTALSAAATYNSNPEVINVLVENGADIHQQVMHGQDALMLAAQFNENESIIKALLRNGADTTRKSSSGKTALDYAEEYKNKAAVSVLKERV